MPSAKDISSSIASEEDTYMYRPGQQPGRGRQNGGDKGENGGKSGKKGVIWRALGI